MQSLMGEATISCRRENRIDFTSGLVVGADVKKQELVRWEKFLREAIGISGIRG